MRELGGDITAADHDDARRKPLELEEAVAGNQIPDAGKCERHRPRASRDEHMPGLQRLLVHPDGIPPGEASLPVKRVDAVFGISPLVIGRYGIGESPFEGDQLRPANPEFSGHAPAAHAPGHVDRLGAADQHLLRVAPAQGAGSAEREVIDDRNRPSRRAHAEARYLRGRTAANDEEIEGFASAHLASPCLALVSRQVAAVCRR